MIVTGIKKIVCEEESSSSEEDISDDSGSEYKGSDSESEGSDQDKENEVFTLGRTPKRGLLMSERASPRTPSRRLMTSLSSGTPGKTPLRRCRPRRVKDVEMVSRNYR